MSQIKDLRRLIEGSDNIVFFGGAGVSTESGIPDFRSQDGLYQEKYAYPPETIVSADFFYSHTAEFYEFYKRKMLCLSALPNAAHRALAQLEAAGRCRAVITQNIDGLHQRAGSKTVLELHGSVHRNFCTACGKRYDARYVQQAPDIARCVCGGLVKPDVVLYGEALDGAVMQKAKNYISGCDVLIIGGTSLAVYPAAGLIEYYRGSKLVVINRTLTPAGRRARLVIEGDIGAAFERLLTEESQE